jgi:hypothetical protein
MAGLTLDGLIDASHLLTFIIGAATGAAGTYFADKATDNRRKKQAINDRVKKFRVAYAQMPELFAEMAADLNSPTGAVVREFVLVPSRATMFNPSAPVFLYYESEHRDLKAKARLLADDGFVVDAAVNAVPRYRMLPDFATLLKTCATPSK